MTSTEPSATHGVGHACSHCTLPVPAAEVRAGEVLQFCCGGCRAVHGALHASGLERYYEMRERERVAADAIEPARVTGRGFESFDDASFVARHVRDGGEGLASAELRIDGIRCGACVWLLEAMPRVVRGVQEVRVDGARGIARIRWAPSAVALSVIARRFDTLGYQLMPFADPAAVARERAATRAWIVRIGIAGAIATNAMAIGFALYGGILAEMEPAYRLFFQWCTVALALVALAFPGRVFLTNAWMAVRARTPHMDMPVAFGLVAAVAAGIASTIHGTGSIYCESAAMLVFLLLVGRFFQYTRQRKAREQVELLLAIVPSVARKVVRDAFGGERVVETPVETLAPGDVVEVTAGEACPADGRLVEGEAHLDLSHLTGESAPQRVSQGGQLFAGSRVLGAPARLEVVVAGAETRAARLLELVRDASERRAPVVELANRISGWFLLVVVALAALTVAWWWPRIGAEEALGRAVAFLVVTCPCALGLATPLAVVAGIGKGARKGVLVKGGDVLERAARVGTLVLDKTGTVTEGRTEVLAHLGSREALRLAAALEARSAHPSARAIVEALAGDGPAATPGEVREIPGLGIEGRIGTRLVRVGSVRFMESVSAVMPDELRAEGQRLAGVGLAPVFVAVQGKVEAVVGIGDAIRSDARETVQRLRRAGWRVLIASGDDPVVVSGVARALGVDPRDALGGLSPEAKLELVRRDDLVRPVVMVGDGVNDLAALAAADVGVAVRNGAQASHHVADVCLAARGIRPLERFLAGSRSTMRTIKANLLISVGYNIVGGALAFLGLVNPLVAAVIMPLSGLTVLVVALRMPSFEIPRSSPVHRASRPTSQGGAPTEGSAAQEPSAPLSPLEAR
jgi:Cu2+-exporting ATPase